MKRVCQRKKWLVYELTEKEQQEHEFRYCVIHPDEVGCHPWKYEPSETDIECYSWDDVIAHIDNYEVY